MASEPVSTLGTIVSDNHDHLVQVGAHLDAASEAAVRRLGRVVAEKSLRFERERLVALVEPGVRNHHATLSAEDSSCVEIYGDLIRLELLVTTIAVS